MPTETHTITVNLTKAETADAIKTYIRTKNIIPAENAVVESTTTWSSKNSGDNVVTVTWTV